MQPPRSWPIHHRYQMNWIVLWFLFRLQEAERAEIHDLCKSDEEQKNYEAGRRLCGLLTENILEFTECAFGEGTFNDYALDNEVDWMLVCWRYFSLNLEQGASAERTSLYHIDLVDTSDDAKQVTARMTQHFVSSL